uniref:Uncharacterized protein n=1 Tax=Caenorhabditis tropicalis TaxID=1561998 RepID=A0A1I7UV74_9PELO
MQLQFFLFSFLLTPFIHAQLSKEENQKRLETCGKDTPIFWFESAIPKIAVPISPRHFITRSWPFETNNSKGFNSEIQWEDDGPYVDTGCADGKLHLEVPHYGYQLVPLESKDDPNYNFPVVIRAYLPFFCKTPPSLHYEWPMIVEYEKDLKVNYPCFTREDGVKVGDVFDVPIVSDKTELDNWAATITKLDNQLISATGGNKAKRDGALLKKLDDSWNLIGISYNLTNDLSLDVDFHRMSLYVDTLCEWAGICEALIPPTTSIPIKSEEAVEKKEEKDVENGKKGNKYETILLLFAIRFFF